MTYGTIFSGIGGWELGLNACGWDLQWQCECDEFCRTLLAERFGVPIARWIETAPEWLAQRFGRLPKVDAIIGSPPCQPFSVAGKKRGVGDERHLYPAFIRTVRIFRPRYVLMEQVANVLSIDGGRVFGGYIGGLVALGYDVQWHCIPACAVGANHQRDRLWIVAYAGRECCAGRREPGDVACPPREAEGKAQEWERLRNAAGNGGEVVADAISGRRNNWAVEPDICRVADGVSFRVDRLKGLGNAVVPQIPYLIGQAINQN